jgi:hypothetical protein
MSLFIALLTKEEFSSLLNFGEIKIYYHQFTSFTNDNINENIHGLLLSTNYFEYAEEYVFVTYHYEESLRETKHEVKLEDIEKIYPLDDHSRRELENDFPDLKIDKPAFADTYRRYSDEVFNINIEKGVSAFREICGLDKDIYDKSILSKLHRGIDFRINSTKYFNIPIVQRDPISMIIAYDRFQSYSNDLIGYFFDAADICTFYCAKKIGDCVDPVFKKSPYYIVLENVSKCSQNLWIDQIQKSVESFEESNKYLEKANDTFGHVMLPVVFLYLRNIINEGKDFKSIEKNIMEVQKKFGDIFDDVSVLIGGFFGFKKFSTDLYYHKKLRIFKNVNLATTTINGDFMASKCDNPKDPLTGKSELTKDTSLENDINVQGGDETNIDTKSDMQGGGPDIKSQVGNNKKDVEDGNNISEGKDSGENVNNEELSVDKDKVIFAFKRAVNNNQNKITLFTKIINEFGEKSVLSSSELNDVCKRIDDLKIATESQSKKFSGFLDDMKSGSIFNK